jgi:hypothetical protein
LQLHLATHLGQEDGFLLDGKLLGYVSVCGQILDRNDNETNINLSLDDGTQQMEVQFTEKWFSSAVATEYFSDARNPLSLLI